MTRCCSARFRLARTSRATARSPKTATRDLVAGLTVAALALPSGMAYAEVAGLPLVSGLYALLLPTVLYTFLGSSRELIVGPEASIADAGRRGGAAVGGRGKR